MIFSKLRHSNQIFLVFYKQNDAKNTIKYYKRTLKTLESTYNQQHNRYNQNLLIKKRVILLNNKPINIQTQRFNRSTPSKSISVRYLYPLSFLIGASIGLLVGYMTNFNFGSLILKDKKDEKVENQSSLPLKSESNFESKVVIERPDLVYSKFPLKLTLFQYEAQSYSSEVRSYLDYYGFSYDCIEVDPQTKNELKSFTDYGQLPILMLEDPRTKEKWFLIYATTILSALETLRNSNYSNFKKIIQAYLPVLNDNFTLSHKNKYNIPTDDGTGELTQLRKWINKTLFPVLRLNSANTIQDAMETVHNYVTKEKWNERFNILKRNYLFYTSSYQLYRNRNIYKNSVENFDLNSYASPLEAADYLLNAWENLINANPETPFNGKDQPNIADITLFGIMKSFEGCEFFRQEIVRRDKFRNWYNKMQEQVLDNKGALDAAKSKSQLDWLDVGTSTSTIPTQQVESKVNKKNSSIVKSLKDKLSFKKLNNKDKASTQLQQAPSVVTASSAVDTQIDTTKNDFLVFKILTLTYLVHVIVFAYASSHK